MTPYHFIRSLLLFACLLFNYAEIACAEDRSFDPSQFSILELIIGKSTPQDIYSKLGPGIPFQSEAEADVTQVCYVSDKDDTLLLISLENQKSSGWQLLSQKTRFYKWHFCEKSPLVSKHLTAANGIKLGMGKNRLKAILGRPRSESDEFLAYVYGWQQERMPAESGNAAEDSEDPVKRQHRRVTATIRAEFSHIGLISFDLSQSLQ